MNKGLIIATVVATLGMLFTAGTVSAQYTPPEEVLSCNVSKIVLRVSESGDVTATLTDLSGKPIVSELVTFQVVSGDGKLSKSSDITDGNGVAETSIVGGASGGPVLVRANAGSHTCQTLLDVVKDPISQVSPAAPRTGDGGLIHEGTNASPLIYAGLGAALISLLLGWMLLVRSHGPVWRGSKN